MDNINSDLGNMTNNIYDYINNLFENPIIIIICVVIIIIYTIFFSSFNDSNNISNIDNLNYNTNETSYSFFMIIIFIIILFLLINNGFKYLFGIDIITSLKSLFYNEKKLDIIINTERIAEEPVDIDKNNKKKDKNDNGVFSQKEVFNISNNIYSYDDAKSLCKAYNSRLATYKEVEEAYNKGAEWCNYGWSANQMAFFPTQQKSWKKLQKIKGHENDCGRPGVNGGYIANPDINFGVNCYGYKPKIKLDEQNLMDALPLYPKTKTDIEMEKKVDYWKNNLSNVIISPFNNDKWNM
jgi:hypothetical protein